MDNGSKIAIAFGILAIGASVYYAYSRSRTTTSKQAIEDNRDEEKIEKIKEKIKKIEEDFTTKAIGFYLRKYAADHELSQKQEVQLFEDYPKEYSTPVINWAKEFDFASSYLQLRDQYLKEYIQQNSSDFEAKGYALNDFEEFMLIRAKQKAEETVAEKLK